MGSQRCCFALRWRADLIVSEILGDDALSERLYQWYEGKLGFRALCGQPPSVQPGDSDWRSCRKRLL